MNFLKYFYNNFLMNYFQFEGVMRASLSLGSSRLLTAVIVITSLSPLNSGQSQHLQLILSSHLCLVTQWWVSINPLLIIPLCSAVRDIKTKSRPKSKQQHWIETRDPLQGLLTQHLGFEWQGLILAYSYPHSPVDSVCTVQTILQKFVDFNDKSHPMSDI